MSHRTPTGPLAYMQRMRNYYLALGYANPYEWAHNPTVPFQTPNKAVSHSRVALVTTAAPFKEGAGDQGPGAPYNAKAKFYQVYGADAAKDEFLGISHVSYDRGHTSAKDIGSYFPLKALRVAQDQGQIGNLAPRYYGLPTNRSQATTVHQDCVGLLAMLQEDEVDLAILVAN